MTSPLLSELLGDFERSLRRRALSPTNAREFWNLQFNSKAERERLLHTLLPYLIVKREAAEIALRWLATVIDRKTPHAHRHYSTVLMTRGRLGEELRSLTPFRPRRSLLNAKGSGE